MSIELISKENVTQLVPNSVNGKRIYDFHIGIACKYLKELFLLGTVTCTSGFIRTIMYKVLTSLNIEYSLETLLLKRKRFYEYEINWTVNMILLNIKWGTLLKNEVIENQKIGYSEFSESEIDLIFDGKVDSKLKSRLESCLHNSYNIFNLCFLYKKIKKISLINSENSS